MNYKKNKKIDYVILNTDYSNCSKEELIENLRNETDFALNALSHLHNVFEIFLITLEQEFKFGKKRMRKFLKKAQYYFNFFNVWESSTLSNLRKYGFDVFFHNGKLLLRDLEDNSNEYFDLLNTDLRILARKLDLGLELTEFEKEALRILKKN